MQPILTIAIPTIFSRHEKYNRLRSFLEHQIERDNLQEQVEVISLSDNKEISIGEKRNRLYQMAKGVYTVMIDDDDWVADYYCKDVVSAAASNPDCITYHESVSFDGRDGGNSLFSNDYPDWIEDNAQWDRKEGCVRVRTPFFKTPIKTEICRMVGVADMRWSEDHDFARRIRPHLKTSAHIPHVMYKYGFVTEGNYLERFGIKK